MEADTARQVGEPKLLLPASENTWLFILLSFVHRTTSHGGDGVSVSPESSGSWLLSDTFRLWFARKAGEEGRGDERYGEDIRDWNLWSKGLKEGVGLVRPGREVADGRTLLPREDIPEPCDARSAGGSPRERPIQIPAETAYRLGPRAPSPGDSQRAAVGRRPSHPPRQSPAEPRAVRGSDAQWSWARQAGRQCRSAATRRREHRHQCAPRRGRPSRSPRRSSSSSNSSSGCRLEPALIRRPWYPPGHLAVNDSDSSGAGSETHGSGEVDPIRSQRGGCSETRTGLRALRFAQFAQGHGGAAIGMSERLRLRKTAVRGNRLASALRQQPAGVWWG